MNSVCVYIGWAFLVLGLIGCFVPMLPGPLLAYFSLVILYLAKGASSLSGYTLSVAAVLTALVIVLDYVVPALGAKRFHCSRMGTIGCLVGTIVGLFFLPIGVVVGPFFGALIGELVAGKNFAASLVGAIGALLGYAAGIVIKVVFCIYIATIYWKSA